MEPGTIWIHLSASLFELYAGREGKVRLCLFLKKYKRMPKCKIMAAQSQIKLRRAFFCGLDNPILSTKNSSVGSSAEDFRFASFRHTILTQNGGLTNPQKNNPAPLDRLAARNFLAFKHSLDHIMHCISRHAVLVIINLLVHKF